MSALRELRRAGCLAKRFLADWAAGRLSRFACAGPCARDGGAEFPSRFQVAQPILPTEHVEAKWHNLRLAIATLNQVVMPTGSLFSFWRLIGRPTAARGFRAGRSLLGGRLATDYGGGLCQLSGIIYHTVLLAGLRVLERHCHSVDIYTEDARFTPLGADATVAFGFKDLRFENTLPAPVALRLVLAPDCLECHFCSPAEVMPRQLRFVRVVETASERVVETRAYDRGPGDEVVLAVSRYRVSAMIPAGD